MKKHLIYFLILVSLFLEVIDLKSQSNWKELKHPFTTDVYPVFENNKGDLVGVTESGTEIFISNDRGLNWTSLDIPISDTKINVRDIYKGIEDIVFVKINNKLLEINTLTKNVKVLDTLFNTTSIILTKDNFQIFDNGVRIDKYDINYNLLESWYVDGIIKKIVKGKEGNLFCFYEMSDTIRLIEIDKEFNFSDPVNTPLKDPYFFNENNGRLFVQDQIANQYSDDKGKSWKTLDVYGEVLALNDSTIIFRDNIYNSVIKNFVSKNNGTQIHYVIDSIEIYNKDIAGGLIASTPISCLKPNFSTRALYSYDQGLIWNELTSSKKITALDRMVAGKDDSSFIAYPVCSNGPYIQNGNQWNKPIILENNYYNTFQVQVLQNNDLIASNFNSIYHSSNYGETWDTIFENQCCITNIHQVENKLFVLKIDSVCSSSNFGVDWNCEYHKFTTYSGRVSPIANVRFLKNGSFFMLDSIGQILFYNKSLGVANLIFGNALNGNNYFETSSQGYIYAASNTGNKSVIFSKSYDEGKSISSYEIENIEFPNFNFHIDIFDNLYIYNFKKLLTSNDEGNTWKDITPNNKLSGINKIFNVSVGRNKHIYINVHGLGILKSEFQVPENRTINLKTFLDNNENCIFEGNEPILSNIKLLIDDSLFVTPGLNGFDASLSKGTHTIKFIYDEYLFSSCNADEYKFVIGEANNNISLGFKPRKICSELAFTVASPFLRRCFDNAYYGTICNDGNESSQRIEVVLKTDQFFDYKDSDLNFLSKEGDNYVFEIDNLSPGECKDFFIRFNLLCTADLGQEHCIELIANAEKSCNIGQPYLNCQTNKGSYDPNDKTIFVNGKKDKKTSDLEDEIEYMIRFQNTGTDTAFNIYILDTISEFFDLRSIKPIVASHPYTWQVEGSTLRINFNNIKLVDSFANEAESNGFILFKLKLKQGVEYGQILENKAFIFFDYNEPIVTNTVSTSIQKPLKVKDYYQSDLEVYPNPAYDFINVNLLEGEKSQAIEIVNSIGQKVFSFSTSPINLNQLGSGVYFIKFQSNLRNTSAKFILQK